MDFNIEQLESYLNNKIINKTKETNTIRPIFFLLAVICFYKQYYLALCLIFLLFLCNLLTRFFRHFQRIVARDFLNRHECDINIYRY